MIRCKFKVSSITHYETGRSIKLNVVYADSPENKAFFASTPSGEISISVVKAEVEALLELGKEFYVDFSPAE